MNASPWVLLGIIAGVAVIAGAVLLLFDRVLV